MRARRGPLALSAVLAAAVTVSAQDSVSKVPNSKLPGDAVRPWDTGEQLNTYIVDLDRFTTSWGTPFALAPIVKSSKSSSGFTTSLISAQAASAVLQTEVAFPFNSYRFWNAPGFGVNDNSTLNCAGTAVGTGGLGLSHQIAAAFAESGTTDPGAGYNGVIASTINYRPSEPTRLFVSRIVTAIDGFSDSEDRASLALGAVDSNVNVHLRGDDFGVAHPSGLMGNNYFRVSALTRNFGALNVIDDSGASDTADELLRSSSITHNTPSIVPEEIAGRPILLGSNFDSEYLFERTPGALTATLDHLGAAPDHRGNVHFSKDVCFSGSVGTGSMLGKDPNDLTRAALVWGVDSSGDVAGQVAIVPPPALLDRSTGKLVNTAGESIHYRSQVAFQGGNGQVATRLDRNGDLLVAWVLEIDNGVGLGGPTNPDNVMLVAKVDCETEQVVDGAVAAYVDLNDGKPILSGPGGSAIGELTRLLNVTGGTPTGPSFSSPAFDSAGNLWFVAAVEWFNRPNDPNDSALIRAVYDPVDLSYELEAVLELGQVFRGRNSTVPYAITFLGIADNNSVSSGTLWSANAVQCGFNGKSYPNLPTWNPKHLGGLVFNAEITYDSDGDGTFDPNNMTDECYNVLLFLGNHDRKFRRVDQDPEPVSRSL